MDPPLHSLPLEILDCIVDELGAMLSEDRKSAHSALLSCHRASRSLRPRTLRHLYEKTHFSNADLSPSARSIKPISVLKDVMLSPKGTLGSVGPYIKSVFATFQNSPNRHGDEGPPLNAKHIAKEIVKFLGDEDVISILQALCKEDCGVQDFILSLVIASGSEHVFHLLNYADLPLDFRRAFSALSRSPHIRSLQIQYENPFRCLIATRLPNSAAASIQGVNRNQASQVERDDNANDYSVAMCTDYAFPYDEMLPQSYYCHLSSLVAYNTGAEHATQTWKLVHFSSEYLRSLSIFQYGRMAMPSQSFNLGQLPKLESFTFLHAISQNELLVDRWSDGADRRTFGLLHQLFNITSPLDTLISVDLRFEFNEMSHWEPFIDRMRPWWDLLDQCLSGPYFPTLRRVRLKVRVEFIDLEEFDGPFYAGSTTRLLKDQFWRLSARSGVRLLVDVIPVVYYNENHNVLIS